MESKNEWLKHKGYLHITPQIDIVARRQEIISKVTNPAFIRKHAFFPLVHSVIKERRYKRVPNLSIKAHSYAATNGKVVKNSKERPLHYSSHMDSLIFGYYAAMLQRLYEDELQSTQKLSDCIIAYRRIPIRGSEKNKSTIHFAKEVFDEIVSKVNEGGACSVITFDIKSFFSRINHGILEHAWKKLLNVEALPLDHQNVFKATTRFSYILFDELRQKASKKNKLAGFDEKRLAAIRKNGTRSFFESAKEFREKIKSKELRIYRFPFVDKEKNPVGIPQGLAISAVLANLYLLDFDKKIFEFLVKTRSVFYRRYSDDILIVCRPSEVHEIKEFVTNAIQENKVEISKEKTEQFLFNRQTIGKKQERIVSTKIKDDIKHTGQPLTYLGFEFYGNKTLIKSANLSKFYRRMIHAVKSKAKQAKIKSKKSPHNNNAIYRRQLYKLYTLHDLNSMKIRTSISKLVKNEKGYYDLKIIRIEKPLRSNYLSYVNRASEILNDDSIAKQVRNHKKVFNEAILKHLNKNNEQK